MDRISIFSSFPEPRGPSPSKEPIEPFIDESVVPKGGHPFINQIQLSADSLNKEGLVQFIENVKPIFENIYKYSRQDQQLIRDQMHILNHQIQKSDLPNGAKESSRDLFAAYNQHLAHPTPFQQGQVLLRLDQFEGTVLKL